MTEIPNTLFSETQRKELSANEKINLKQKKAVQKWKNNLDANLLDIESQYKDYLRDLMMDALGYPGDKIKAETGEKNTRLDYSYTPSSGTGGVLFELKSRNKKPFKPQGYSKSEQETPVDQAITYIEKNPIPIFNDNASNIAKPIGNIRPNHSKIIENVNRVFVLTVNLYRNLHLNNYSPVFHFLDYFLILFCLGFSELLYFFS